MDSFRTPGGPDPLDHTTPYHPGQPDGGRDASAGPPARGGRRRLLRWAAGVAAAGLLAGGLALGLRPGGTGPAAPAGISYSGTAAVLLGASGQARLGAALGAAPGSAGVTADAVTAVAAAGSASGHPGLARAIAGLRRCAASARRLRAEGHPAAARARLLSCLQRYRGLALRLIRGLLRAIHGQLTFRTAKGFLTVAFERGVIQSAPGGTIAVKAADGTSATWDLTARTVVVRGGRRVGAGALRARERVFVIGPVVSGADDARLVVILR